MKTELLVFTSLVLLLTSVVSSFAQLPPEAREGLWKAQWITSPSAPQRDAVVLHFRKALELSQVPEHFVARFSADAQFVLCVNEHEVGRGPARSDLAHSKYETYDVAAFLRPGRNEFAATAWNFGVTPLAQISDRTACVLRGDSAAEAVVDADNSWEVEEDKGVQILPTGNASVRGAVLHLTNNLQKSCAHRVHCSTSATFQAFTSDPRPSR
jgi:alpha-L-rhamnosidase